MSRSAGWGDPLLAARYHRDFSNGFGLTAYGDFGGFDVGAHVDWQVIGTLDYALKPWATLGSATAASTSTIKAATTWVSTST